MASRFLPSASALALIVAACSGSPENSPDSDSTHTEIETAGSAGSVRTKDGARAGAAGRTSTKPGSGSGSNGGNNSAEPDGSDAGPEAAGMGGAAGEAGEPPPPCDLDGNCDSDGDGAKVTCGVEPWFECEFNGFVGATAQVGWGQRAVIGTACCGACECVPVEVYFDGKQCWQGIPQCTGNMVKPHETTTPNPSFTVPTDVYGTFYVGTGGFGGSANAPAETGGSAERPTDTAGAAGSGGSGGSGGTVK